MENFEPVGVKDTTEELADDCTPTKQLKTEDQDDQVKPEAATAVEAVVHSRDITDNEEREPTEEERKAAILERLKRQGVRSMFGGPVATSAPESSGDQPLAAVENKPRRTHTMPPNPFLAELSKKIGAETSPVKKAGPPVARKAKPTQDIPTEDSSADKVNEQNEAAGEIENPGSFWQPISSVNQPNESNTDVDLPSFDTVPHDGLLNIRMQKERATGPRRKGTVKQALGSKTESDASNKPTSDVADGIVILSGVTTAESDDVDNGRADDTHEDNTRENLTNATNATTAHVLDGQLGSGVAMMQPAVEVQLLPVDLEVTEKQAEQLANQKNECIETSDERPGLIEGETAIAGPSSLLSFEIIEPEPSSSELNTSSSLSEYVKQPASDLNCLSDWSLPDMSQKPIEQSSDVLVITSTETNSDLTLDWVKHRGTERDDTSAHSNADLLSDSLLLASNREQCDEPNVEVANITLESESPAVESYPVSGVSEASYASLDEPKLVNVEVSYNTANPVQEENKQSNEPQVSRFELLLDVSNPSSEVEVSGNAIENDETHVVTDHSSAAKKVDVNVVDDLVNCTFSREDTGAEQPPSVTMTSLEQLDVSFATWGHPVNAEPPTSVNEAKFEDLMATSAADKKPRIEKGIHSDQEIKEASSAGDIGIAWGQSLPHAEFKSDLSHDRMTNTEIQLDSSVDVEVSEKNFDALSSHRVDRPVERHHDEHENVVSAGIAAAVAVDAEHKKTDVDSEPQPTGTCGRRPSLQINSKELDLGSEGSLGNDSFVLKQHTSGELEIKFDLGGIDGTKQLKLPDNGKVGEDSPPPPLPSSEIPNFQSMSESSSRKSDENHETVERQKPPVTKEELNDVVTENTGNEDKNKDVELSPSKGSQRGAMYKLIQLDMRPVKRAPEKDKETTVKPSESTNASTAESNASTSGNNAYVQQRLGLRRTGTVQDQGNEEAKKPIADPNRRKSETPYNRFAGSTTPTYRSSALQPACPAGGWTPLRSTVAPKSPTVTVPKPSGSSVNLLDERRKLKKVDVPETNASDNGSEVSLEKCSPTPMSPLRVTTPVRRQSSRDIMEDQLKSPAFIQEWDRIRQQRQLRSPSAKSAPPSSRDSASPVPEFKKLAAQLTKRHAAIADAEIR